MRRFLFVLSFLIFSTINAQESWPDLVKDQASLPVYNNLNGLSEAGKSTIAGPINPLSKISVLYKEYNGVNLEGIPYEGSVYLFESWKNRGIIEIDKKRYLFDNINFNIKRNSILSKLGGDSLYVFDLSRTQRVIINNREFKTFYYPKENTNRVFEVVFKDKENYILKGYSVSFIEASPNPMVNRPTNRIVQAASYFTYKDGQLKPIKLNKSNTYDFLKDEPEKLAQFKKFMKENRKSFKDEKAVKQALRYCNQN